jgi:hypothetical protein
MPNGHSGIRLECPPPYRIVIGGFCMFVGADNHSFPKGNLGQASSDQRRFRRYSVRLPCRVKPTASGKSAELPQLEAETLDISRGGLCLLASAELAVGTAFEFELDLPTRVKRRQATIRCWGTITRVVPKERERIGMGATINHLRISTFKEGQQESSRQGCESGGKRVPMPPCVFRAVNITVD